ncbi:chloramphenicol acetyltransferase, partial [Vibrio cholerae]
MSQYGEIILYGPNPNDKEPMKGFPQVGYLKNYI